MQQNSKSSGTACNIVSKWDYTVQLNHISSHLEMSPIKGSVPSALSSMTFPQSQPLSYTTLHSISTEKCDPTQHGYQWVGPQLKYISKQIPCHWILDLNIETRYENTVDRARRRVHYLALLFPLSAEDNILGLIQTHLPISLPAARMRSCASAFKSRTYRKLVCTASITIFDSKTLQTGENLCFEHRSTKPTRNNLGNK